MKGTPDKLSPPETVWIVYAQNEAPPDVEFAEGCINGENPFLFVVLLCIKTALYLRGRRANWPI
jgi:hypothetical protein